MLNVHPLAAPDLVMCRVSFLYGRDYYQLPLPVNLITVLRDTVSVLRQPHVKALSVPTKNGDASPVNG